MRNTYYSVFGCNGLGVFNDYSAVLKAKHFLNSFNCKKHNDFEQAKAYAIQKYNEFQISEDKTVIAPSSLDVQVNWVIYRNEIRKIHLREDLS